MKKINITHGSKALNRRNAPVAFISINGQTIRKNAVLGTNEPPIRIARSQSDSKPIYAHEIHILGPSQLLYSADEPIIRCGARLALCAAYGDVKVIR